MYLSVACFSHSLNEPSENWCWEPETLAIVTCMVSCHKTTYMTAVWKLIKLHLQLCCMPFPLVWYLWSLSIAAQLSNTASQPSEGLTGHMHANLRQTSLYISVRNITWLKLQLWCMTMAMAAQCACHFEATALRKLVSITGKVCNRHIHVHLPQTFAVYNPLQLTLFSAAPVLHE